MIMVAEWLANWEQEVPKLFQEGDAKGAIQIMGAPYGSQMLTTARNRLRNDVNNRCSWISGRTKMTSPWCNGEETDLREAEHSRAYVKILGTRALGSFVMRQIWPSGGN